jgi:hypothetical protein
MSKRSAATTIGAAILAIGAVTSGAQTASATTTAEDSRAASLDCDHGLSYPDNDQSLPADGGWAWCVGTGRFRVVVFCVRGGAFDGPWVDARWWPRVSSADCPNASIATGSVVESA